MSQSTRARGFVFVSAIDRHYVIPYSVLISSFRSQNPEREVTAFVLHYDLTPDDVAYLEQVAESMAVTLHVIAMPQYPFLLFTTRPRSSLTQRRTMSPVAYAKAFIDRFLPDDIDRAIIIDADIVVVRSMEEIRHAQLSAPIMAVANIPRQHHHQFNSGFMLVDLAYWRRMGVAEIAERFLFAYSDALHTHDQHTLNLIFKDRWSLLGLEWNYMEEFHRLRARSGVYSASEIEAARANPVLIHYAVGEDKPWRADCQHPKAHLYRGYYKQLKHVRRRYALCDPQRTGTGWT